VNHGVPPQLFDETFRVQREFYELPDLEERLKKYSIYTDKEMSKVATMEAETIHYPSNWRDNMILACGPNEILKSGLLNLQISCKYHISLTHWNAGMTYLKWI
jgi:isopenicillin N synthase-like dioxygenase